jgi:hypothetical protein
MRGAAGVWVSTVKVTGAEFPLVFPDASRALAVSVWVMSVKVLPMLHRPAAFAVVESDPPLLTATVTRAPGSDVPSTVTNENVTTAPLLGAVTAGAAGVAPGVAEARPSKRNREVIAMIVTIASC